MGTKIGRPDPLDQALFTQGATPILCDGKNKNKEGHASKVILILRGSAFSKPTHRFTFCNENMAHALQVVLKY